MVRECASESSKGLPAVERMVTRQARFGWVSFLDEPPFRVRAGRDGDFWNGTTVTKRSEHMGDGSDRRAAGDDPRLAAGSRFRSPVAGLLASLVFSVQRTFPDCRRWEIPRSGSRLRRSRLRGENRLLTCAARFPAARLGSRRRGLVPGGAAR